MARSFIPSLTDVAPEVLAAQARPVIPFNSPEFSTLYRSLVERLQLICRTSGPVYLIPATGYGMVEAAVGSLVANNLLVCVNGYYSEQWAVIAEAFGKEVDRLEVAYGEVISAAMLRDAFSQKHYDAVVLMHVESSSGAANPLQELCEQVHLSSPDSLLLVDGMSSLSALPLETGEWGIDYLMATSHGSMGILPGIGIAALSERALQQAEKVSRRGWYFDVLIWEKYRRQGSSPMMANIPLMFALDVQLDRILSEGLDERFARYQETAATVRAWFIENELSPLAQKGFRAATLTTILNTRILDYARFESFLFSRGLRIGSGIGLMKDKTFRIGHMGEVKIKDVEILLETIGEYLQNPRSA